MKLPGDVSSPTARYLEGELVRRRRAGRLAVLDVGCGKGALFERLLATGHDLCGYDLASRRPWLETRLRPILGAQFDDRIRLAQNERTIPFESDRFDLLYAHEVFEHVLHLDRILEECARVLRPGGALIATFPPTTTPVEGHYGIPFVHWLPAGPLRVRYCQCIYACRLRPRPANWTARQQAEEVNRFLATEVYYRLPNEIAALGSCYFENTRLDTAGLVRAKLELLAADPRRSRRLVATALRRLPEGVLTATVTHMIDAAWVFERPRKAAG